ncbi:non-specific serine/threonine protein kinase, partial [Toxoplasma gondii VAND]
MKDGAAGDPPPSGPSGPSGHPSLPERPSTFASAAPGQEQPAQVLSYFPAAGPGSGSASHHLGSTPSLPAVAAAPFPLPCETGLHHPSFSTPPGFAEAAPREYVSETGHVSSSAPISSTASLASSGHSAVSGPPEPLPGSLSAPAYPGTPVPAVMTPASLPGTGPAGPAEGNLMSGSRLPEAPAFPGVPQANLVAAGLPSGGLPPPAAFPTAREIASGVSSAAGLDPGSGPVAGPGCVAMAKSSPAASEPHLSASEGQPHKPPVRDEAGRSGEDTTRRKNMFPSSLTTLRVLTEFLRAAPAMCDDPNVPEIRGSELKDGSPFLLSDLSASASLSSSQFLSARVRAVRKCIGLLAENRGSEASCAAAVVLPAALLLLRRVTPVMKEGEVYVFRQSLLTLLRLVAAGTASYAFPLLPSALRSSDGGSGAAGEEGPSDQAEGAAERDGDGGASQDESKKIDEARRELEKALDVVAEAAVACGAMEAPMAPTEGTEGAEHRAKHPERAEEGASGKTSLPGHMDIAATCLHVVLSDCEDNAVRALSVLIDVARISSANRPETSSAFFSSPSFVGRNQKPPFFPSSPAVLPRAGELLHDTLPQLYTHLMEAIRAQVKKCKETGKPPEVGELPLGVVNREAGQLVPSVLSIRVAGDIAYCLIALSTRLPMMLLLLQHPTALQRLLQHLLEFVKMEVPGAPVLPRRAAASWYQAQAQHSGGRTVFYDFLYAQTRIFFLFCYLIKNAPAPPPGASGASQKPGTARSSHLCVPTADAATAASPASSGVADLAAFLAREAAPSLPALIPRLLGLLGPPFLFKRKTVHESLKLLISSPRFRRLIAPHLKQILCDELAAVSSSVDALMLRAYAFTHIHDLLIAFASDLATWDVSFLAALLRTVGAALNADLAAVLGAGEGQDAPRLPEGDGGLAPGGSDASTARRRLFGNGTSPENSVANFLYTRQLLVKIVSYVIEVAVKNAHHAGAFHAAAAATQVVTGLYQDEAKKAQDIVNGERKEERVTSDNEASNAQMAAADLSKETDAAEARGRGDTSQASPHGPPAPVPEVSVPSAAVSWRSVDGGKFASRVDERLAAVRSLLRQAVRILAISLKALRAMIPALYAQAASISISLPSSSSPSASSWYPLDVSGGIRKPPSRRRSASSPPAFYPPLPAYALLLPYHRSPPSESLLPEFTFLAPPAHSPLSREAWSPEAAGDVSIATVAGDVLGAQGSQGPATQQALHEVLKQLKNTLRTTAVALRCALYYQAVLEIEVEIAATAAADAAASTANSHFLAKREEERKQGQAPSTTAAPADGSEREKGDKLLVSGQLIGSPVPAESSKVERGASCFARLGSTQGPPGADPIAAAAASAGLTAASTAVSRMAFDVRLLPRGHALGVSELEVLSEAFFDGLVCARAYGRMYAACTAPCLVSCLRCGGSGAFSLRVPDLPQLLAKASAMAAHDQTAAATAWPLPPPPSQGDTDVSCVCCTSGPHRASRGASRPGSPGQGASGLRGGDADVGGVASESLGFSSFSPLTRCAGGGCRGTCCCSESWATGTGRGGTACQLFASEQQGYNELALTCAQAEEREAVEVVASSLTFLHPANLRDFALTHVGRLYGMTCLHPSTVMALQFFFAHQHTCVFFAEALLSFLLQSLPVLSERKFALLPPLLVSSPLQLRLFGLQHPAQVWGSGGEGRRANMPFQLLSPNTLKGSQAYFYFGSPPRDDDETRGRGGESGICDETDWTVDSNRATVYRQFDACKLLSREAQMSDLVMSALDFHVPLPGEGVFTSLVFPHTPPHFHRHGLRERDLKPYRRDRESRHGRRRNTNGVYPLHAKLLTNDGGIEALLGCDEFQGCRHKNGVEVRESESCCMSGGGCGKRREKVHTGGCAKGFSSHQLFLADIFDLPPPCLQDRAVLVADHRLDLQAGTTGTQAGEQGVEDDEARGRETLRRLKEEEAVAFSVWEGPHQQELRPWSQDDPDIPPSCLPTPVAPRACAESAFVPGDPRLTETPFSLRSSLYLRSLLPFDQQLPSPSTPSPLIASVYPLASVPPPRGPSRASRDASFVDAKLRSATGFSVSPFRRPTNVAGRRPPLTAPAALDVEDAAFEALHLLEKMMHLIAPCTPGPSRSASRCSCNSRASSTSAASPFPAFPGDALPAFSGPRDTAHVAGGEEGVLYSGTGYARMTEANTHLRLYRYLLKAVVAWPECEARLTQDLLRLCKTTLSLAAEAPQPYLLLGLLRALFRQTTPSGRSSVLYTAFLPFLPEFLSTSRALQRAAGSAVPLLRNLWVEVSLMAPARLKNLLPHLSSLVHPVLAALSCGDPEVVTLALRTVELWVENLRGEYIYPILASQFHGGDRSGTRPPLLLALLRLLQQPPALAEACCGPLPPSWGFPALRLYHASGAAPDVGGELAKRRSGGATTSAGAAGGLLQSCPSPFPSGSPGTSGGPGSAPYGPAGPGASGTGATGAVVGSAVSGGQAGYIGSSRGGLGGGGSPLLLSLPQMTFGTLSTGLGSVGTGVGTVGTLCGEGTTLGPRGAAASGIQWMHLQHQQEKHALMVIRILGKLGGKNRAFLKLPHVCAPRPFFGNALVLGLPMVTPRGPVRSVSWSRGDSEDARSTPVSWVSLGPELRVTDKLIPGQTPVIPVSHKNEICEIDSSRPDASHAVSPGSADTPNAVGEGGAEASDQEEAEETGIRVAGLDMDEILRVIVSMLEAAESPSQAAYLYHATTPQLTASVLPRHLSRTQEQAMGLSGTLAVPQTRLCDKHKRSRDAEEQTMEGDTDSGCGRTGATGGPSEALRALKHALEMQAQMRLRKGSDDRREKKDDKTGEDVQTNEEGASSTETCEGTASTDEDSEGEEGAEGPETGSKDGSSARENRQREARNRSLRLELSGVTVCEGCIAAFYRQQASRLLQLAVLALLDLSTPLSAFWLACVNKATETFAASSPTLPLDAQVQAIQDRLKFALATSASMSALAPDSSTQPDRAAATGMHVNYESTILEKKLLELQEQRTNFAGDRALPTAALRPLLDYERTRAGATPERAPPPEETEEGQKAGEDAEPAGASLGTAALVCSRVLPRHKAAMRTSMQRQAEQDLIHLLLRGLLLLACDGEAEGSLLKQKRNRLALEANARRENERRAAETESPMEWDEETDEVKHPEDEVEEVVARADEQENSEDGLGAMEFLRGLLRHLAFIAAARIYKADSAALFIPAALHEIDPVGLLRGLQPCLSLEPSRLLPTLRCVQLIEETARLFCVVQPHSVSEAMESFFASSLCQLYAHLCFAESWRSKAAGCLVLIRLLRTLPPEWAQRNMVKIAEAAMFVSKDATAQYAPATQLLASECLMLLFTVAFCGYAGSVRPPFLQLAFGLKTSPLWREETSGDGARKRKLAGACEGHDGENDRKRRQTTRGGDDDEASEAFQSAMEEEVSDGDVESDDDDDQEARDLRRFTSPPASFLEHLRLAAEGCLFRAHYANLASPAGAARVLVPPPLHESSPLGYRDRRSRPAGSPWWMKRSEWITWETLRQQIASPSAASASELASRPNASEAPAHSGETPAGARIWRPAEEVWTSLWKVFEKLVIPNLYQVRPEARRLAQQLFVLVPRLLGTDAATLLAKGPVREESEEGAAKSRGSLQETERGPRLHSRGKGDSEGKCPSSSATPFAASSSALTRVLKWVTLRPVALLTLQWQAAFLDCNCFLATLRPTPHALRPLASTSEAPGSPGGEAGRDSEGLSASGELPGGALGNGKQSECEGDFANSEAAAVVCWIIEDALAVLAKGLEAEAINYPSPLLVKHENPAAGPKERGEPRDASLSLTGPDGANGDTEKDSVEGGLAGQERGPGSSEEAPEKGRDTEAGKPQKEKSGDSAVSPLAFSVAHAGVRAMAAATAAEAPAAEGTAATKDDAYTMTLLLALRFLKLALIHPDWQGLLSRPRSELQKIAQHSRASVDGREGVLGGAVAAEAKTSGEERETDEIPEGVGKTPVEVIMKENGPADDDASATCRVEATKDGKEEEEGGLLLEKSLNSDRSMREHCGAMLVRFLFFAEVEVARGAAHALRVALTFCGNAEVLLGRALPSVRRFFLACRPASAFPALASLLASSPINTFFFLLYSPASPPPSNLSDVSSLFRTAASLPLPAPPIRFVSPSLMRARLQGLARLLQLLPCASSCLSVSSLLFDAEFAEHLLVWFLLSHREAAASLEHAGLLQERRKLWRDLLCQRGQRGEKALPRPQPTTLGSLAGLRGAKGSGGVYGEGAAAEYFRLCGTLNAAATEVAAALLSLFSFFPACSETFLRAVLLEMTSPMSRFPFSFVPGPGVSGDGKAAREQRDDTGSVAASAAAEQASQDTEREGENRRAENEEGELEEEKHVLASAKPASLVSCPYRLSLGFFLSRFATEAARVLLQPLVAAEKTEDTYALILQQLMQMRHTRVLR